MDDRVLISNVMMLPAALLLAGSLWMYRRTRQWHARVLETEAEVVAWVAEEDDSGISYRAVYRYAGIENDVVGGNHNVRTQPTIGEKAVIYYDPSYPTNAFIRGSKAPFFLPGCGFVLGLALLAWAIYVRFDSSV